MTVALHLVTREELERRVAAMCAAMVEALRWLADAVARFAAWLADVATTLMPARPAVHDEGDRWAAAIAARRRRNTGPPPRPLGRR